MYVFVYWCLDFVYCFGYYCLQMFGVVGVVFGYVIVEYQLVVGLCFGQVYYFQWIFFEIDEVDLLFILGEIVW